MFLRKSGIGAAAMALLAFSGLPRPCRAPALETGFQPAASPVMEQIETFHTELVWIIVAVCLFVLALLVWIVIRYRAGANPVPSKVHHNTLLEVAWTLIPVHDPGVHRGAVLPPAVFRSDHPQARRDHEGHRQAVVLEL